MNKIERNLSFWSKGKREQQKFYEIKLKTKTNIITFIMGLFLGAFLILPFALMLFQYLMIYGYNMSIFVLYLTIIWVLMMTFNGLSNYFTVKMAQAYNKDMVNLQAIKPKYIFFYQIFNIGFGIVSLFLIVFFGLRIIGVR